MGSHLLPTVPSYFCLIAQIQMRKHKFISRKSLKLLRFCLFCQQQMHCAICCTFIGPWGFGEQQWFQTALEKESSSPTIAGMHLFAQICCGCEPELYKRKTDKKWKLVEWSQGINALFKPWGYPKKKRVQKKCIKKCKLADSCRWPF